MRKLQPPTHWLLTLAAAVWDSKRVKYSCILFSAILLAGCAGRHPKGTASYDDYDAVKVEQMVGNNVSQAVFAKTIVCLNARREIRRVTALTNVVVTSVTNQTVNAITNQTISMATNMMFTTMTNLAAAQPQPLLQAPGDATTGTPAETNAPAASTSTVTLTTPQLSTNVTVSLANNVSATAAPSQRTANSQLVRTLVEKAELERRMDDPAFLRLQAELGLMFRNER